MSLDKSILRRLEKTQDEQLGRKPVESGGPDLHEVAQEPEFGLYLDSLSGRGHKEMWTRYKDGTNTEADYPKLIVHYREYLSRKKDGTETIATIEDYMVDMIKNSPEFRDLSDAKSVATIKTVLEKGLRERVQKDPAAFAMIKAEFQKLRDFEENVEKPLNARIKDWCDKNNIPETKTLHQALLEPNRASRQKAIHDELMKDIPTFRGHLVDMFKGVFGGGTRAQALELSREDPSALIAQREQLTRDAGVYARNLLVKDKEFREALSRIPIGKEPPFPEGAETKMTMSEASGSIKTSHMLPLWNQYLADHNIQNLSQLPPDQQETVRDDFTDQYEDQYFKDAKGGFWQAVARMLFGKAMKKPEIRSKLK